MEALTTIRKVLPGRAISREEAKKLWLNGKVAGLFNIPFDNQTLFDACQDFCVEVEEEKQENKELDELRKKNDNLQQANVQILKNVISLREKIASLTTENLTKEEEGNQLREKLKKNSAMEKEKSIKLEKVQIELQTKWTKEKEEFIKQNEKLQKKIERLQKEIELEKQKNKESLIELDDQRKSLEGRTREEEHWRTMVANDRENILKQHKEIEEQLNWELREVKKQLKTLVVQIKDYYQQLKEVSAERDRLEKENDTYRYLYGPVSQSNQLNRQLLQFYRGDLDLNSRSIVDK